MWGDANIQRGVEEQPLAVLCQLLAHGSPLCEKWTGGFAPVLSPISSQALGAEWREQSCKIPAHFLLQGFQNEKQADGFALIPLGIGVLEQVTLPPTIIILVLGRCENQGRGNDCRVNACTAPSPKTIFIGNCPLLYGCFCDALERTIENLQ